MEHIAEKKLHFAPLERQQRAIGRLLREGRFRNTTEFLRAAVDHYLDNLGRPPLSEQARQMAEEIAEARRGPASDPSSMQASSMGSDESW